MRRSSTVGLVACVVMTVLLASCSSPSTVTSTDRTPVVDPSTGTLNVIKVSEDDDYYLVEVNKRSPENRPTFVESIDVLDTNGDPVKTIQVTSSGFNNIRSLPGRDGWNQSSTPHALIWCPVPTRSTSDSRQRPPITSRSCMGRPGKGGTVRAVSHTSPQADLVVDTASFAGMCSSFKSP